MGKRNTKIAPGFGGGLKRREGDGIGFILPRQDPLIRGIKSQRDRIARAGGNRLRGGPAIPIPKKRNQVAASGRNDRQGIGVAVSRQIESFDRLWREPLLLRAPFCAIPCRRKEALS